MDDVRDFSKPRVKVSFTVDDDQFDAPPVIPAMVLMEYAQKFQGLDEASASPEEQMKAMTGILELVLYPVSYERFLYRLGDRDNPIDLEQMQQIIEYLMERYGLRPTVQPSSSLDGLPNPESGTHLTENTPVGV